MTLELAILGLIAVVGALILNIIYTWGQKTTRKTLYLEDSQRYAAQQVRAVRWKCAAEALYHNLPFAREEYEVLRKEEERH